MEKMSKTEAKASIKEMSNFVDFMNEPCEDCNIPNKDCECLSKIEDEARYKHMNRTVVKNG